MTQPVVLHGCEVQAQAAGGFLVEHGWCRASGAVRNRRAARELRKH
jgi:hypothetical protein